ncbi:unnamed protein product [Prunus armeniaca]
MAAHTREREREREEFYAKCERVGRRDGDAMGYILVADEKQRRLDYEKSIVCITKNQPRRPGRVWEALDWSGLR